MVNCDNSGGQHNPASDTPTLNCHHHQAETDVFEPKVDQKTSVFFQFEITAKQRDGMGRRKKNLLAACIPLWLLVLEKWYEGWLVEWGLFVVIVRFYCLDAHRPTQDSHQVLSSLISSHTFPHHSIVAWYRNESTSVKINTASFHDRDRNTHPTPQTTPKQSLKTFIGISRQKFYFIYRMGSFNAYNSVKNFLWYYN